MALDKALLPNLKNLDPSFLKPSYDPTGEYHVIKDFGITMFFYNNKIVTEQPKTMQDFYGPAQVREQGPHQPPGRRRRGRAARADGARPRPQHRRARPTSTR